MEYDSLLYIYYTDHVTFIDYIADNFSNADEFHKKKKKMKTIKVKSRQLKLQNISKTLFELHNLKS